MIQPSILYGFFLAWILVLYWLLPGKHTKHWIMLISSIVFYASLQAQYVPLMLILVGLNYAIGKSLATPLDWRIPNEAWQPAQAASAPGRSGWASPSTPFCFCASNIFCRPFHPSALMS